MVSRSPAVFGGVGDGVWLLRTSGAPRRAHTATNNSALHQLTCTELGSGRPRRRELLAARCADAHGSQKRAIQQRGLVVCALCACRQCVPASRDSTLACHKAVEQRVNAALEDSSNPGEADASRRCWGAGFTGCVANRFCPRRVRGSSDTTSSVGAALIIRLLQPAEKTARSAPYEP